MQNVAPDDREHFMNSVEGAIQKNEPFEGEYHIFSADGQERFTYMTGEFTRNQEGDPESMFGIIQDITERKRADELFRTVATNSPVGVYVIQKGKFVYTNKHFQEYTGYSEEELLGMTSLNLVLSEDRNMVRINTLKMLKKELVMPFEFRTLHKSGEIRWSAESVAFVTYHGERAIISSFEDITERKKREQQLMVTDRLASVGELAAGIAHELSNPLTGVITMSDLLLDNNNIPSDIKEDLKVINNEAMRAGQVAKNLLTFARRHPDRKQPTDVNKIIEKVLELRDYEQKVHNIKVITNINKSIPTVSANDFQLQQVFINLIINAEFFMTETNGGGTLTITTREIGDRIQISFADNGPGIPLVHLPRIFDPFYTTKEVGKGTGLGLSICYGIITEHNGQIYAESEPGNGAVFTIELPVSN